MEPRVTPNEADPTHHLLLTDRSGMRVGLTVCDDGGSVRSFRDERIYVKIPVETTAQKQTSGSSSYADFDYPYSPIVQDDVSGGRGSIDFERDSTKFFDSFRCRSGRANRAYAGPQEKYATGLRSSDQSLPGSVKWVKLFGTQRYVYKRFQSAGYTAGLVWLLVRRMGIPGDLTIAIHADSGGSVGSELTSITVAYTRLEDILMEWLNESITQALTNGAYYWLVIYGGANDSDGAHWKVGIKDASGSSYYSGSYSSTPTAADFDLYFRITDADSEKSCIPFGYKEQQYFVISAESGAPTIYMAGSRGAADSNSGDLGKLKDGTKSWTTNEWAGCAVMITDGTGRTEKTPWRTIVSNTGTELVVDEDWTITQDTTTEYVILGDKLTSLGACGLTSPVTDVHVSTKGVIYFCMGDDVTVRRMRAYNDAGTWREISDATNCQADETAGTKAVLMEYMSQAVKIVIANNKDASGNVSIAKSSNVSGSDPIVPDWGTALTWATAVNVDSKYNRINGMIVHPDNGGNEAVWVMKNDRPWIIPSSGNPYSPGTDEMETIKSFLNGRNPMRHGVYLYTTMGQGLERYYGGQWDDIGPNTGHGLPSGRRGYIVDMVGYPGRFFAAVDSGDTGYSSVMDSDGWHERYRAPKGQRIGMLTFQVTPGNTPDRLWIHQGNDLVWLPFPSESTNELEDANYTYTPEFAVTLSRMHAGMFDVQKLVKKIKIQSDGLEIDGANGEPVCWFELDYRLNEDDEWTTIQDKFIESPTQEVDFTRQYGIAGKRMQFRIRGYTTDESKTPVFLAIIISAVIRVDIKSMYGPFTVLLEDDKQVGMRQVDNQYSAAEKLAMLEDFADASNDSMLLMNSVSTLLDGKMVFLNMGTRRQIRFAKADNNEFKNDAYVVSLTMQEA